MNKGKVTCKGDACEMSSGKSSAGKGKSVKSAISSDAQNSKNGGSSVKNGEKSTKAKKTAGKNKKLRKWDEGGDRGRGSVKYRKYVHMYWILQNLMQIKNI